MSRALPFALFLALLSVPLRAEDHAADHEALRSLLATATACLNEQRFEDLAPHLASEARLTFVDQTVITDVAGIRKAWEAWISPESQVASVSFAPKPAELTVFPSPDVGIARGTSDDTFTLKDGRSGVMTSTWTATVLRQDGAWKITSLHVGVDPLNNPIIDMVTGQIRKLVLTVSAVVAAIAFGLGMLVARKRKTS